MESPAVAVSDEDGSSGLVQPVTGDIDGLETRIVASTAPKQPADAPVVPAEAAGSPACGVKRLSGEASTPQSKRS